MGDQLKGPPADKGNLACDVDRGCCEWTTVEPAIDQLVTLGFVVMVVKQKARCRARKDAGQLSPSRHW
jgi:hypothetical protein